LSVLAEESTIADTYTNLWFNSEEGVFTVLHTSPNKYQGCAIFMQNASDVMDDYLYLGMDRTDTEYKLVAGISEQENYINSVEEDRSEQLEYSLVLSYKQGLQLFSLNSIQPILPDTSNQTFDLSTVTRMWVGNNIGTDQINGYVKHITYFSNFMEMAQAVDGYVEQPIELDAPVLSLISYDDTEIIFNFTLVKNAVNYEMEVSTNSDFTEILDSGILIGLTGSYTYERVNITQAYWFRIRAITTFENGAYSNSVCVYYQAYITTQDGFRIVTQDLELITTE
jgi:hypothetical protein